MLARVSLLMLVSSCAVAQAPYVFIGAEIDMSRNKLFCVSGSDTSNFGIGKSLFSNDLIEIDARWTHHSCITEYRDKNVYDAIGVQAKMYLW
jgi:hypothetical protein